MKYLRWFSFLVCVSSLLQAQTLRIDPQLAKTVQAVRESVNGNQALDFVAHQHETDRWFDFSHFQQTADYLQATMKAIGLRNVEMGSAPADGISKFGYWTMPLAWDVKRASLEIVEPSVPADLRVLADYSQEPDSLVMWSGPTPPGGVTAEVVELKPATLQRLKLLDVKGKMVLTEPPLDLGERGALKAELYKMGAAGMMSYATENLELINSHYWMNAWGDHGWGYIKNSSPLVGFSITPRQGAYLSNLLARGTKVRVKATSDTRYYAGRYPYVTGVIPGSDPQQEVLELGHAFEPGAQDNSTGVAAMLESLATLQRLISAGKLAPPKRSIRILVMAEDYGSSAYIAQHMPQMKRTIGAMCVDTPAGLYDQTEGYTFALNPDVNRSYQDALIQRAADSYYAGLPQRFPHWSPYQARSDSYLSDPMIGIPTLSATASTGAVNVHHNSADTLDRVDPRSLRDLSAVMASFFYYLASAEDRDIPWLAEITVNRSYDNAIRAATPYLNNMESASAADVIGKNLYSGLAQIKYNAERDRDAFTSMFRLASSTNNESLSRELDPLRQRIQAFADLQSERLHQAANRRATEIGASVPVRPLAPMPDASRAEATRVIVKRKQFGPVTLDDLPLAEREGFPGFGDSPAPLVLLNWCDGNRSLAEVIRLVELEHGPMKFDFVGYFKFLAKHGYVELVPSGQ
jgi:hypothetical protein